MGLGIKQIEFREFRNYSRFQLDDIGELTIFVGPNAVGKTNVLEGIQLLTSATSFRHPQITQVIREGAPSGRISLRAEDEHRSLDVALSLEAGKRKYSINGKTKSAADVRGVVPSVMFTPDDLQLVKRSSSVKRAALDDLGVQLTRNYYIVRRDFEKTVRYKNRLLREEAPRALVESINETLVTCGAQLFCLRQALFERIVPHVARVYAQLAGDDAEEFSACLTPSWQRITREHGDQVECDSAQIDISERVPEEEGNRARGVAQTREIIAAALNRWYDEERRRARCLIGPHNDEILFSLSDRNASAFASQGQQRSIVLAWKLAESKVVHEVLGVSPVLLLDDVLSELDGSRREMLVRFVTSEVQTFVTATDLDGFAPELVERARIVQLPIA